MPLEWNSSPLAAGLACYRNRDFFEAHEHWEEAWNQLADPEKNFVQGLIQVTVAMHHYHKGNRAGALSLLRRALRRFERCGENFAGVDVASLAADVGAWVQALEENAACMPGVPRFTIGDD
jgi:predicted metal-dependent hydrolase